MVENVNRTCDELHFNGSFRYTPPPGFQQSEGSELAWYAKDGTVLSNGGSLIRAFCESGIRLIMRSFNPRETHEYNFQVTNQTIPHSPLAPTNGTLSEINDHGRERLWLLLAVALVAVVALVLYGMHRKHNRRPKRYARKIPTKNITAENDEEAQAFNGHAQDM